MSTLVLGSCTITTGTPPAVVICSTSRRPSSSSRADRGRFRTTTRIRPSLGRTFLVTASRGVADPNRLSLRLFSMVTPSGERAGGSRSFNRSRALLTGGMRPRWTCRKSEMAAVRRRGASAALCLLVAAGRVTSGAASVPTGSMLASVPTAAALFCARPSLRLAAVCAGASLHVVYHVQLGRREKEGVPSWRTEQALTRVRWAGFVLDTKGWLYAVQTLRNAITANTFLASTQISLFTLIIGFLWQSSQSPGALAARVAAQEASSVMLAWAPAQVALVRLFAQFGTVATFLLCSAYQFLQSARLMTHAGEG